MEPNKPSARKKSLKEREKGKDIPEDLIEVVVARLPIAATLHFRSVCKKWNSLLRSPNFLQLSQQLAPQTHPWFFITYFESIPEKRAEKITGALYDPCMNKWHHDFPSPFSSLYTPCEAGGLVCYPDDTCSSFHVGNPLTQTWKKVPFSAIASRLTFRNQFAVGIVRSNQDRGYVIVWVDKHGIYEVYDSLKKSSNCQRRVPTNIRLPYTFCTSGTVSVGTVVYFLCSIPHGIISYDVVSGVWNQFLIPTPLNLVDPLTLALALAECGGRLFLIGLVKSSNLSALSVCVWELQMKVWTEVDKMPRSWCSEFIGEKAWFKCHFQGNKSLLMVYMRTARKYQIFTYDVLSREWCSVPQFVAPGALDFRRKMSGIGFFPSLLAAP